MQIDVISDTVCPWCFIGKRRLMRAMASRPHIAFDVKWRPYRLDPTVPKGDTDAALVERENAIAHEMGVTGVPAMIFGGKLAVSGAREAEVLASVIDRVTEMNGGEAASAE